MSRKITKVISFKIENKFDKWVKFFESKVICIPRLQREIFKKLFKQIVNGLKVTKWISQLWNNNPGYESLWDC